MGIRFRKTIKINDFIKLNVSKTGLSATVGKKGASVNLGKGGAFLNLGLAGTGVSYRQKLIGGKSSLLSKLTGKKDEKEEKAKKPNTKVKDAPELEAPKEVDMTVLEEYAEKHEAIINIHKYTGNVFSSEELNAAIDKLSEVDDIVKYQKCIDGDEDTIEETIGEFNSQLQLDYEANVSYELEGHDLYVDLDLPEIENLEKSYPCLVKNEIVQKEKTANELKEEYANMVMSLGVFLAVNYFNVSSFIDRIILSAFTQVRNKDGERVDEYLYSVKFTRDIFLENNIEELEDLYAFINKFENRINLVSNSFKAIKPYEMQSKIDKSQMIEEAISALKNLGYKDVDAIKAELDKQDFAETQDYLKYALKNIAK